MPENMELTEESTHEDISETIDKIIADRAEAAEEEETSDAEKLGTGKAVTERETEDTDEDTADENETSHSASEKTGKTKARESKADWREEAIAEASAYGFSEEEIAEFETREELDRALKLFDRQLDSERDKLGKKEGDEDKGGETQKSKGNASVPEDGRYEVRLDKDVYDDELVDEFTRLRDHYESRIAALEGRFSTADAIASEERFDRSIDDFGFVKLFGKTGEENDAELARRKELFEQVEIEQEVLSRRGRRAGDYNALVQRVARSLWPEDFEKRAIVNHTRKISRQSNGRQGGGVTRPTDAPASVRDEMRELYKELSSQSG